jgi:drug/metabolite transporter (DMT)-like permease
MSRRIAASAAATKKTLRFERDFGCPVTVISRRQLWLYVGVVIFWGINWPMMKLVLAELDLWVFRSYCLVAGIVWFAAYHVKTGISLALPREHWWRVALSAVCNVTAWNILSAAGLALLPAGRAGILAYTMPLWAVILSRIFLGEALTTQRVAAITIGMLGVALLLLDEFRAIAGAPLGALMMIAAGLIWAVGTVVMKGIPKSIPTTSVVFWGFVLGGWPVFVGLALFGHGPWVPSGNGAWLGLVFNLTIVFGFCWFAWNALARELPAQVTGISSLAVPIVGFISGVLVLGEVPRPFDYVALTALVAAVALVLKPTRA